MVQRKCLTTNETDSRAFKFPSVTCISSRVLKTRQFHHHLTVPTEMYQDFFCDKDNYGSQKKKKSLALFHFPDALEIVLPCDRFSTDNMLVEIRKANSKSVPLGAPQELPLQW